MPIAWRSFLIATALSASASTAQPPPPALVPEAFAQTIDGYDVAALFQIWRFWVERQKGPAVAALLAEPEQIDGERSIGPLLTATYGNDFGPYMTAELRLYCRTLENQSIDRASCHLRYRRAYVPLDAAAYGAENAVSRWTRDNFDPQRLTPHLRRINLPPETNWWSADRVRMFSALPSATVMLQANATIVSLDARDCPALAAAMSQLESARMDWRHDFSALDEDQPVLPPPPHAVSVTYRLNLIVPGGGFASIEGWGRALDMALQPTFDAIGRCERERRS